MAIDKESSRIKAGCPKPVLWGNREVQDGEGAGLWTTRNSLKHWTVLTKKRKKKTFHIHMTFERLPVNIWAPVMAQW